MIQEYQIKVLPQQAASEREIIDFIANDKAWRQNRESDLCLET